MAFFDINPVDSNVVTILAAGTATQHARFIAFGATNDGATTVTLIIYDGTAAGTVRARFRMSPGSGFYEVVDLAGKSVFPKKWWTANTILTCALSAAGSIRVFGEAVRED